MIVSQTGFFITSMNNIIKIIINLLSPKPCFRQCAIRDLVETHAAGCATKDCKSCQFDIDRMDDWDNMHRIGKGIL